jgi:hypothetical protein
MKFTARTRTVVTLAGFAILFVALTVNSYVRESATWDEPQFLLSGYLGLKDGDHRLVPGHPPFVQMWAALPLLATTGITVPAEAIPRLIDDAWIFGNQYAFTHATLYRLNNADSLLYRGRFMIVLLGVLLGILLFCWAQELYGFGAALAVLASYCAEPNLLAHARLITTDFGTTCFVCGTAYFLWRTTRAVTVGNLLGLAVFFALAQVSKFSGVLLLPVVLALLEVRCRRQTPWPIAAGKELTARAAKARLAIGVILLLAVSSYGVIWATYGFRYAPAPPPAERYDAAASARTASHSLPATVLQWVDRHHLLPNLYTQGFLLDLSITEGRSAFLAGHYSNAGWWYYFPVAMLVKTPLAILLLFLLGLVLCVVRWRTLCRDEVFLIVPLAVFLAVAMTSHINIGLRHVLPVYPFLLLIAGKTAAELLTHPRKLGQVALAGLGLLALAETARVYPHYLAFFNQSVGGPRNGYQYLVDSNLDWGQDLKGLKRWMDANQVQRINLCYFGTADPAYYGIECTYLPGGPFFTESQVAAPQLPGYVAVSATQLQGVYLPEQWRIFYRKLQQQPPVAVIGHSIHVYRVERPWWR